MPPNDQETYLITINCPLESETPMLVILNPMEVNLLRFLENLCGEEDA